MIFSLVFFWWQPTQMRPADQLQGKAPRRRVQKKIHAKLRVPPRPHETKIARANGCSWHFEFYSLTLFLSLSSCFSSSWEPENVNELDKKLNWNKPQNRSKACLFSVACIFNLLYAVPLTVFSFPLVPTGSPSRGGDVTVNVKDVNQPSLPTPFCSVLVHVFMVLSTVFHSINPPNNSPFSHSVLPVLSLPYWCFQLYISLQKFPTALV